MKFNLGLNKILFLIIILIGILLRFNQLGNNPPSLNWDEASLGYNAYSILKTGADEYGTKFPISIRSFGDYKPPLYVYLAVPSVAVFGLSEFSVRFPSALLGVLSIIVMYFFVLEIFGKWDIKQRQYLALISAFFIAISPWSLQFSRAAYEGNIGLFFMMLGLLLFIKGLKNSKIFLLSVIPLLLSIYSYHSFRLLVPLLIIFLGILFWKEIIKDKLTPVLFILIFFLFSLPVYMGFVKLQDSSSRLSMVTIFSDPNLISDSIKKLEYDTQKQDYLGMFLHNRRVVYAQLAVKGYLDHFNPDFLFLRGDGGVQHHAVDMGMLYLWELPFIVAGIYSLMKNRSKKIIVLLFLFLIAPLPSSISTGTPHPVRAIAMVFPLHIFSAVGFLLLLTRLLKWKNKSYKLVVISTLLLGFGLNIFYYLHQYYVHSPIEYGYFWQYGNKEVINYAKEHENEYKKIIMTYRIDQPYIYYLFYNKIDPSSYQKSWSEKDIKRFERKIGKYEFRYVNYEKDSREKDALLIGTPEEIPNNERVLKEIKYLDGTVAYRIARSEN